MASLAAGTYVHTFLYSVHGRVSDRACTGHGGIIIAPLDRPDQRKKVSMVSPMTVEDSTQQKKLMALARRKKFVEHEFRPSGRRIDQSFRS